MHLVRYFEGNALFQDPNVMEGFVRLLFPFYYVLSMIVLCPLHALRSYIAIEEVQASFEAGNLNEFDTFLIYRISYSAPSVIFS